MRCRASSWSWISRRRASSRWWKISSATTWTFSRRRAASRSSSALAYILSRDLNVAATDAYIERLLEAKTAPESEQQKTFILKDVRVFLNTISHSLDLMKQGGIDAGMHRQETDEALILTINIPKARRREPAPKQGEPVPVG